MNDERYTLAKTNVRFARSKLWLTLSIIPSLALLAVGLKVGVVFFMFPLPIVVGFLAKGTEEARVEASLDGLRVGERLVPRSALKSALLRHEGRATYVRLHGDREIDVEVPNNVEADALVRALGLDAASTTLDVRVDIAPSVLAIATVMLVTVVVGAGLFLITKEPFVPMGSMAFIVVAATLANRVTLRIGADGIVFSRVWMKRFVSHDEIDDVAVQGAEILVHERRGRQTRATLRGGAEDEALAVARRITQARQAHRVSAGAPELAVALDRGARSTREWIGALRKLGAGAASTFRTLEVSREQLVELVESTSARAKDRIAAIAALHGTLKDEEERRVRVAVDRIAAPNVRDHMVRVLDARDDEALEAELEAFSAEARAP